jgi:Na+/H+-dicarboxylate symporter
MFGIPAEASPSCAGVDRLLDMARTTVSVAGDLTATAFVARSEDVGRRVDSVLEDGVGRPRRRLRLTRPGRP